MMNKFRTAIALVLALTLLLTAMLCACGRGRGETASAQPVPTEASVVRPTPTDPPEAAAEPGRADGERFEEVVVLEGMEETVRYEHVRNQDVGFELDYEYETLERRRASEYERFLSLYDDPDDPWNYLEVTRSAEGPEAVTSALAKELSRDFDTVVTSRVTLDRAGECARIDASGAKAGRMPSGALESVYILPAADGCRIAAAHCTLESAEGFGARFAAMMDTFIVTESAAAGGNAPA